MTDEDAQSRQSPPEGAIAAGTPATPAPAPPPFTPPPFVPAPDTGAADSPVLTASGLPNPHGLPELAVERPEIAVGAAFGGGLVLALILKRLGR